MRILLTNDDGILAPGLAAIYRELIQFAEVDVVAPQTVQSASGHGITVRDPLTARRIRCHGLFDGWAVDGRPADCVKLAVGELLDTRPDLVVSGMNEGANVAIHVLYSGTVAAAAEGAILGIPAVAVSLEYGAGIDFARGAAIAGRLVSHYAAQVTAGAAPCALLSINIPEIKPGVPRGIRVVPQATCAVVDNFHVQQGPDGENHYTLSGWFDEFGPPDYDLGAMAEGYVTLTPLHFDMTAHERLAAVRDTAWPDVSTTG